MSELKEIEFWGDALVRWPNDVVAKMGIAEEDAAYLFSVGLPTGVDWNLDVAPPAPGSEPRRVDGMPVLAFDGPVPICAEDATGGGVVAVEDAQARLVNSSVRQFGGFLMIYQDYRLRVRGLDDAGAEELIDEIERRMRETDGDVMGRAKAYWPLVVEQMREGFL